MAAKNNPTVDHAEPDPSPFKVHLMTRAGRIMRARGGPVREFSTKDEAVKFAGRQLGGRGVPQPQENSARPVTRSHPNHAVGLCRR
jgi:hypothetical protein